MKVSSEEREILVERMSSMMKGLVFQTAEVRAKEVVDIILEADLEKMDEKINIEIAYCVNLSVGNILTWIGEHRIKLAEEGQEFIKNLLEEG